MTRSCAKGCIPFHCLSGVLLTEENGKPLHSSACVRCDAFDGFPCLVNGKADAQIICVDPALRNPNLTLLTNAYVERLETSPPAARSPRSMSIETGPRNSTAAISSWCHAGRSTRRCCCCDPRPTGIPTDWPTDPMWSAGTTCATTTRPSWRFRARPIRPDFKKPWR